jgi:hypothetical protein
MADWGAGYANAASGLANIFMGKAQQNVRGREQAAEEARRLKEQKRQELMQLKELEVRKGEAEADRQFRLKLMKEESNMRSSERAAEREAEANDPFRKAAEDRAERAIRVQEQYASRSAGGGSSSGGGGTGLAQPRVPDSVLSQANNDFTAEVKALVAAGRTPEQAQGEAFAKLQSVYDRDILARIRPGLSNMQGQVNRTVGAMGRKAGDVMQYFNP